MNPDTLKLILEKHLLWCKDLPGGERANLTGANLARADLACANLADANLAQSRGIPYAQVAFSGHGECGRLLSAVKLDGKWKLFCGCFKGTFDDLDAYIRDGKAEHRESRTLARNVLHMLCDHEDQKGNNP